MAKHRLTDYQIGTVFFDAWGRLLVVDGGPLNWIPVVHTGKHLNVGKEWEADE